MPRKLLGGFFGKPVSVAALVVGIAAFIVAWKNYNKSPEMALDYHRVVPIINPLIKAPGKLEIQSDGKPVNTPFIILATIRNPGDLAIESSHIVEPPSITFPPYIKVLGATVVDRSGTGVNIRTQITNNKLTFLLDNMLNKHEGADLEILVDGIMATIPRLKARIPNVNPSTTYSPCGAEYIQVLYFNMPFVLEFILVLFGSVAPLYVAWGCILRWRRLRNKVRDSQFVAFLTAITFTLITVGGFLLVIGAWHNYFLEEEPYANIDTNQMRLEPLVTEPYLEPATISTIAVPDSIVPKEKRPLLPPK